MQNNYERFMVSQAAILIYENKCLILKDHKTGQWLLPGGRADIGEIGEVAFKREIKEEIGLEIFENLGVVDYDVWYTAEENYPMCAIANLIKNNGEKVILSFEHTDFKWISLDEVENYDFRWPKAARMIKKGFEFKKLLEDKKL